MEKPEEELVSKLLRKKVSRRDLLRITGKAIKAGGAIMVGSELAACLPKGPPEYGTPVDKKFYTVLIKYGEDEVEYANIREQPYITAEILGKLPTQEKIIVKNVRKVWGSSTGAAHGITKFPNGQEMGWWFQGVWPSAEEKDVPGFISSQVITIEKSYDKPIE